MVIITGRYSTYIYYVSALFPKNPMIKHHNVFRSLLGASTDAIGLSLGSVHPLASINVNLQVLILKQEPQVLQGLGEPEALHLVEETTVDNGHIAHARVSRPGAGVLDDVLKGLPGHVLVLGVAGDAEGVVERLDGFRAQDVSGGGGPEASLLVELGIVTLGLGVELIVDGMLGGDPSEALRADAGDRIVCLVVGVSELDSEVNVLLLIEENAAEDEVATSETAHYVEKAISIRHPWLKGRAALNLQ